MSLMPFFPSITRLFITYASECLSSSPTANPCGIMYTLPVGSILRCPSHLGCLVQPVFEFSSSIVIEGTTVEDPGLIALVAVNGLSSSMEFMIVCMLAVHAPSTRINMNPSLSTLTVENTVATENDNVVFFWRTREEFGEFSQWFRSSFTYNGIYFSTAEQCMMYNKALIFNDFETANVIRGTPHLHPNEHRKMGIG
ncbi:hypothetical protein PENDEC_c002G06749 [Penicillium decumbens]|uniref:NADAR domain-containing protein n=1 Tax=Penicillium decumbens TaxID=69771 RepID=A0A1V6PL38_PENDC|nr:hypothetical protein PENDEC_c002G06749 [Penicillium decumbens]